jgi:hypothetical protein
MNEQFNRISLNVPLNTVSAMITPQIQNPRLTVQKLRMQKEIKLLMALQQLEKASIAISYLNWARSFESGDHGYLSVNLGFYLQLPYLILHVISE